MCVQYLESTGQHDPTTKVYITCDPQPHIALWLTALVFAYLPKFQYDRDFGTGCEHGDGGAACLGVCHSQCCWCGRADTLVRRKSSHQIDGAPFILGLATILKQLHPSVTQQVRG